MKAIAPKIRNLTSNENKGAKNFIRPRLKKPSIYSLTQVATLQLETIAGKRSSGGLLPPPDTN